MSAGWPRSISSTAERSCMAKSFVIDQPTSALPARRVVIKGGEFVQSPARTKAGRSTSRNRSVSGW